LRHFDCTDPDIYLRAAMKAVRPAAQESHGLAAAALIALVRLLAQQTARECLTQLPTTSPEQRESEK